MKFGKTIQSQQVPGWGEYYLNYKALKKIINSYAAGRPASDASLLSLGQRPAKRTLSGETISPAQPPLSTSTSASLGASSNGIAQPPRIPSTDLDPLPPETEPPAPSRQGRMGTGTTEGDRRSESFKAHRDVFFFTLQRELEKINAFYLLKERDLRLRLLTLLTNRKRLLSSQTRGFESDRSEPGEEEVLGGGRRRGVEWASLEEGWRLFERDLGKLQGFIEINATGFRKILKKWDKRSKSNTKELYLERQVEVQPCFNREFIAKLSDIVAANLLDLENGSETLPAHLFADLPEATTERRVDFDADAAQALAMDALLDLEANLDKALSSGREALVDWLKLARAKLRGREKRVMRILWRAALSVHDDDLDIVLNTVQLDFESTDNINERTPLHLACIAGKLRLVQLCVQTVPLSLEKADAYDRRPIHYAAMHGHPDVSSFLLGQAESSPTDMDGYTPLMHAISRGHLDVVRIFVNGKIPVEPTKVSNDLIPLSLACQYGHVEVARLLLASGAKVLPNSEGLYPQHFAAKAGHEEICRLLVEHSSDGGGKDRADKYNLWTPLHHAAVGGGAAHLACIKVLVDAGCDVNVPDEYGKSPGWYAAWFGHVECLNYLLDHGARLSGKQEALEGMENLGLSADPQQAGQSPGSDVELDQGMEEFELIPSLSLPPPIIPVYGHEFLAQRCLVQLSLGHPFSRSLGAKVPPVKLYSRSGQDPLHLWSSLKLVMTSKSDISAVPHSVILPLPDEREVFSFQVASLERFTLELSLYPTFGSKVIGRAIILPSTFLDIRYHKGFIAPLLDHHLKTIGEVAFEVSCIRPFQGAQLEIGGRVETYWKSKVAPTAPTQDHAHQYQAHRPLSVSSTPSVRPAPNTGSTSTSQPKDNTLVTASSLSGEYINVVVQVTKDGVPVVYPEWRLPVGGLDIGVPDVTIDQFCVLASSMGRTFNAPSGASAVEWYQAIEGAMAPLAEVLEAVPIGEEMGLNIQLRYSRGLSRSTSAPGASVPASIPTTTISPPTSTLPNVGKSIEVNSYVDAVLHTVYDAAKNAAAKANGVGRKMVFSSYDPTVCTALNWKQPNYAVFFASYCGISKESHGSQLVPAPVEEESDLRCLSVREAVNFAKSTNLLGVILEGSTLAAVPSLVASVKDAGLLLATCGDATTTAVLKQGASDGRTVDAFVHDGIMTLTV